MKGCFSAWDYKADHSCNSFEGEQRLGENLIRALQHHVAQAIIQRMKYWATHS